MSKRRLNLANVLTVLLVALMVISAAPSRVHAEDPTVAEYAQSVSSKMFYEFNVNKETYDPTRSTIPKDWTLGGPGDVWYAYYPDSMDYYGTKKSIKLEIEFVKYNRYEETGAEWMRTHPDRKRGIRLLSDNEIELYAVGVSYRITYTFYDDPEFTKEAQIYGAIGFEDPDFGNYYYPANTKKLYYYDAGERTKESDLRLSNFYRVTSEGLIHIKNEDTSGAWHDFDNGTFAVPLTKESSFTYIEEGLHDYLYLMGYVFQTHAPYKVEYYYETVDGYPETPDYTSDDYFVDIYETPEVSITDADKIPNPEKGDGYVLDESDEKKAEWKKEINPNGSTVLRVYFEQEYTIKYDPNCKDAEGTMEDNKYTKSAPEMMSTKDWTYTRPGYRFIGYKVEDEGDLLTDPADYKEKLLKESDREIVLYAQWDPLDYFIKYNKNADDATGEMSMNTYWGSDETMFSKKDWTFVRPGYSFIGYKVEDEGDLLTDPADYKAKLLKEEDRTIELFAQWDPNKYTIKYNKNADDAEGVMTDNVYLGSSDTMPSREEWTFTREGYDFIGFKLEDEGPLLNGSVEYKPTLLEEEDLEIELFAQWDPWKYTIKYDPNCTNYTGEMPDHQFTYDDAVMNSDSNQFKRKGYKFLGFVYTDPDGKQTLYKDINDFRAEFMKLGKDSEILLVAQWKKIPEKTDNYTPPVTGVE